MKLTLRDLFWLVLVCAMGLGWLGRDTEFDFLAPLFFLILASVFWFAVGFVAGITVKESASRPKSD